MVYTILWGRDRIFRSTHSYPQRKTYEFLGLQNTPSCRNPDPCHRQNWLLDNPSYLNTTSTFWQLQGKRRGQVINWTTKTSWIFNWTRGSKFFDKVWSWYYSSQIGSLLMAKLPYGKSLKMNPNPTRRESNSVPYSSERYQAVECYHYITWSMLERARHQAQVKPRQTVVHSLEEHLIFQKAQRHFVKTPVKV